MDRGAGLAQLRRARAARARRGRRPARDAALAHRRVRSGAMISERQRAEEEIARTTASIARKAHQLEQRVVQTRERIEHMVDPREQVRDRPWRAVSVALVIGFAVGWWS